MTTIATAQREYFRRPADEKFYSLESLIHAASTQRDTSRERQYNIHDLRVQPLEAGQPGSDLALVSPAGIPAAFSHWSFGQLARTVGAPAGYLRSLPAPLAADCLNAGIAEAQGARVNVLVETQPQGSATPLRLRACTSDSYARVWDAELYGRLDRMFRHDPSWQLPPIWPDPSKGIPDGTRGGAYRGDRDSFVILCNGGSIVQDPSRANAPDGGQMYRAILLRNSEVGAASIQIDQVLYRYICGNLMLWGAVLDRKFRRRHVGQRAAYATITELATAARQYTQRAASADEALIRTFIETEIASSREAVISELRKVGYTQEQAETAYTTCERTEPTLSPWSVWGLAQGTTRASQETPYQDERLTFDRLAAQLLTRAAKVAA